MQHFPFESHPSLSSGLVQFLSYHSMQLSVEDVHGWLVTWLAETVRGRPCPVQVRSKLWEEKDGGALQRFQWKVPGRLVCSGTIPNAVQTAMGWEVQSPGLSGLPSPSPPIMKRPALHGAR